MAPFIHWSLHLRLESTAQILIIIKPLICKNLPNCKTFNWQLFIENRGYLPLTYSMWDWHFSIFSTYKFKVSSFHHPPPYPVSYYIQRGFLKLILVFITCKCAKKYSVSLTPCLIYLQQPTKYQFNPMKLKSSYRKQKTCIISLS
jgi:hypothetical protein